MKLLLAEQDKDTSEAVFKPLLTAMRPLMQTPSA